MASGIEAELKVRIDLAGARRLARLEALDGFDVVAKGEKRLTTTYFDTPDYALRKREATLRLRRSGRLGEQTAKIGGTLSLGLAARPEFTVPHLGRTPVIDKFEEEDVRAALEGMIAGRPLVPLFSMRMTRRRWVVTTRGGDVVEVSLDRGRVIAGERTAQILEAEFELVSGNRRALFDIAKAALRGINFSFSTGTKAGLGYDLLDGRSAADAAPVYAVDAVFDDDMPLEAAMQAVLRSCAAQIAGNVAAVRVCRDAEGPHQLRVGLRRLRSALSVFSRVIAPEAVARLREEARRIGGEVAVVRDLDVLIDELVAPLAAHADLSGLLAILEKRRTAGHAHLAAVMADPRTGDFLIDLIAFVEGRGWLSSSDIGQSASLAAPVDAFAVKALGRARTKVARLGRNPDGLSPEDRHELRKKYKLLRYAYDFFSPVLDKGYRRKLLPRVKTAQDVLGVLNDIHMAHVMLDDLAGEGAGAAGVQKAIGFCLGWHAARADAIWKRQADDVSLD